MNSRRSLIITVGVLLVFFILCIGETWIVQTIGLLLLGWAFYLKRVIPQVQPNYSAIALFAIMLPIAIALTHAMLKWLWNGLGNQSKWKWKWTGMSLSILMLLFFTGMAATGIVHQTGWLINSPKPLVIATYGRRSAIRIRCASNLRQLGQALKMYREQYANYQPRSVDDWVNVLLNYDADPRLVICYGSSLDPAPSTRPAELRKQLNEHPDLYISYGIATAEFYSVDGRRKVLLYDKTIDNHEDGINLLYDDGTTEWLDEDEAIAFLDRVQPTAATRESGVK